MNFLVNFQVSKQRKQKVQKIAKMIWQKCLEIMSCADWEVKNSTRKIKCDVCNQTLTPELTLSEHKIMRHPMAGDIRVMRPAILKRSRLDTNNTNGGNELNYQCIRCSYASNNSSNLGRHLEVNDNYYKVFHKCTMQWIHSGNLTSSFWEIACASCWYM